MGGSNLMDIVPLPHKEPYKTSIKINSLTPGELPEDNDEDDSTLFESPVAIARRTSLNPSKGLVPNRRGRVALRLLSLTRNKGWSASSSSPRPQPSPSLITVNVTKANVPASPITRQSVMDYEDVRGHILPHFLLEGENDTLPRISQTTFLNVLDGEFGEIYTHRIVIDSRFEYEYKGGHIDSAINYNNKELLARHLFETPIEGKVLLIFHCEYSYHRAPMMARHIRSRDRSLNADFYPRLTYPDIYILDGGYREFFVEHRDRCYLQSYVKMNDQRHAATCEREMGKLRQKRRTARRADNRVSLKDVNPWPKHEPA